MSSPGPVARDRTALALSALFWLPVSCAAVLVAVWPPHTVDGPAHLLGALAFVEHTADPSGVYAGYYERDLFPTPNLAGTVLLAELVRFTSLRVAETIVLVLAAVGIPLALRFAIRAVRPGSQWLAIVGLPLSFGYLYFYGFYNYCLAIVLALVCVGVMLRAAPDWRRGPTIGLALLLTATWLTHLVPFVAAVVFLVALVVTGPRRRRPWTAAGLTVLPGVALSLAYLAHTESGDSPSWSGWSGRVPGLLSLHTSITTFSRREDAIALAIALVLVVLAAVTCRAVCTPGSAAGVAAVAMTVLLVVAPTRLGLDFGLIDERLAIFPVLFAVLWLAASPLPVRGALAAALALVIATGALLAVRVPELRRYDRLAEEYASVEQWIEPGSTLVALRFARFGPDAGRNAAWDPTRHLASGLAASTRSIDIGHYEAVLDYFPARFAADFNLRSVLDPELTGLESLPPRVDLDAVLKVLRTPAPAATRGPTPLAAPIPGPRPGLAGYGSGRFYVLIVGAPDAVGAPAAALRAIRIDMAADYERMGVTAPGGLVEVWRAR